MRILMLLEKRFPPDIRVENEAASLLAAGHDVHLLCRGDARDEVEFSEALLDLEVHVIPTKADRRGWSRYVPNVSLLWFHDAHWAHEIRDLDRRVGPFDAIHVHDLPLVKTALTVGKGMKAQVVADLHENYPMALAFSWEGRSLGPLGRFLLDPRRWETYERTSVPECSAVIAVNEEMRSRLGAAGVPLDKITLVENFVETERFLAYPPNPVLQEELEHRYVITYVGGFGVHRGLETAIKSMPAVTRSVPNALLMLVGDGGNRGELESLTAELGLEKHVRFEGWADFAAVPSFIASSDVCIVTPISTVQTEASLPHKLFQYMLMGKPVVATACAGISRVVEDAGCGVLIPPDDSDALAEALVRLTDPDLQTRFGEHGRQAVRDRYSWSHATARLLNVYDQLEHARATSRSLASAR